MFGAYKEKHYLCSVIKNKLILKFMKAKLTDNFGISYEIVSKNVGKRTYTIKTQGITYRSLPMPRNEFEGVRHWTGNDWRQFMRSNEYTLIKK